MSLVDASVGETLLLLNYVHHDVASPYRASHAIFVREGASPATPAAGETPEVLARRLLSVRAYDETGDMVAAEVVDGRRAGVAFARLLDDRRTAFLHAHNAAPGCFAARVDRA